MRRVGAVLVLLATPAAAGETVLQPGSYGALHINGQSGTTIRCAEAGACRVGSGSTIDNSSGVTLDGLRFEGGGVGLTIEGSRNITVQRSQFIEQSSSGVLIAPGRSSSNVVISGNEFRNDRAGCAYTDPGNCTGHLADGSPVAWMDYGLRVYSADGLVVQGNRFGSLFNHAISLKYGVDGARISENQFDSCGRTCIELGQEGGDPGPAVTGTIVSGNAFTGLAMIAIHYGNERGSDAAGNSFAISGRPSWGDYGGGGGGDDGYVYVPPVLEGPTERWQRILGEGGVPHNCCADLPAGAGDDRRAGLSAAGPGEERRLRLQETQPPR